jgi:hypothetical protein
MPKRKVEFKMGTTASERYHTKERMTMGRD